MEIASLLDNKLFIALASGVGGAIALQVGQFIFNKRSTVTYNVRHSHVGVTTDDQIYGSIQVTWNGNPVPHLYLSTVEITNQSMKDIESLNVRIFSNNTLLLTQSTQIFGTTRPIDFSDEYHAKIDVPPGEQPTNQQFDLYRRQRDYIVPTFNRGQTLKFEFLNSATTAEPPMIWLISNILVLTVNLSHYHRT